jgi:hypothetical protein
MENTRGNCPNLPQNKIEIEYSYHNNTRKGRLCNVPTFKNVRAKSKYKSLFDNSICVRGPKLFNSMPKAIRDFTGVPFIKFKRKLDNWLSSGIIVDEPPVSGYPGGINNSLVKRAKDHAPRIDASDGSASDAIPPPTSG